MAIDGIVGAGKSTIIEIIKADQLGDETTIHLIRDPITDSFQPMTEDVGAFRLINESDIDMLEKMYDKDAFAGQLHIMNCIASAYQRCNKQKLTSGFQNLLTERSALSARVFIEAHKESFSPAEYQVAIESFNLQLNHPHYRPDFIIFVDTKPEEATIRVAHRNRSGEFSDFERMLQFNKKLRQCYLFFLRKWEHDFGIPYFIISHGSAQDTPANLAHFVCEIITYQSVKSRCSTKDLSRLDYLALEGLKLPF